jgi:hypothetical protein
MLRKVLLLGAATCGAAELSTAQLSQLERILQGEVSKKEVEIVLAHFNEDPSWSDPYASVRTIYCKGTPVAGCVPMENIGREGHTYLKHIVDNYENLADWTVFSQAGAPTVGYNGHRLGGGHMQPGVDFHDYLLRDKAQDSFFVFTGALHLKSLFHAVRASYLFPPALPEEVLEAREQCPNAASDHWERLDLPEWFHNMMASKCGFAEGGLQAHLQQYWQKHVKADLPEDGMLFFAQGARFAVSKEKIHQRPREEYVDMLNQVSESSDPCANYMNEWLWYYLLGGKTQRAPCATDDIDIEAPMTAAARFLSGTSGTPTPPPTPTPASPTPSPASPTPSPASSNATTTAASSDSTASGAPSRFGLEAAATSLAAVCAGFLLAQ